LSGLLDKKRMMKINISKQKYLSIETQEKASSTPKRIPDPNPCVERITLL